MVKVSDAYFHSVCLKFKTIISTRNMKIATDLFYFPCTMCLNSSVFCTLEAHFKCSIATLI